MQDNRGTLIEVGATVCYNYSGEIAWGVLTKIVPKKKRSWRNEAMYNFHVRRYIGTFPSFRLSDRVSIVTRKENLMVIFDEYADEIQSRVMRSSGGLTAGEVLLGTFD